jgi:regulator of protease activity HflC (stomatin/prohibitin superfamily)
LRLTVAGLAGWWLVSNVVFLSHDEMALVTRFGKVHAELGTGWHWRWPAPFERIYRAKPDHLRTLTYGFRSKPLPAGTARPVVIDWTSPHEKTGEEPIPDESLLLTADEVPIELTALVQYRIADLRVFAFGNANPEESLRAITGQTLRSLAASASLDDMLTVGRANLERQCLAQLRRRSVGMELGLEIVDVQLVEVHPPRAVVPSYRDVATALEEKELRINEAQAAANSRLLHTVGPRALEELKAALNWDFESARKEPATLSDDNWRDVATSEETPEGPRLSFLAGDTADVLLEAQGSASKRRESAQGEADRFGRLQPVYREQPELTSTELYWKTLEAVLSSRPFTILDPKAVGRRHFLLNNPDAMAFPSGPILAEPSSERTPRSLGNPVE